MTRALMVLGTSSSAGKSTLVSGLGRVLARRGVRVAPFKAQNMALNSAVTSDGLEIGRAQFSQATACKIPASVEMNPILLKPTSDRTSQVVVEGRPRGTLGALDYQRTKGEYLPMVLENFAKLSNTAELILLEGAGSPAEINLGSGDLVNLGLADALDIDAVLISDIENGGLFAHIYGTRFVIDEQLGRRLKGFVINRFRGDRAILEQKMSDFESKVDMRYLGTLPYVNLGLPEEDSLGLRDFGRVPGRRLDSALRIGVVRLPRISNFTDFDPLSYEEGVEVALIDSPSQLFLFDVVILPGSKATVSDYRWLCEAGFDVALRDPKTRPSVLMGICGGYQMLGRSIEDDVESETGMTSGLGLLEVKTTFATDKCTRQVKVAPFATSSWGATPGYQIHHGRVNNIGESPWLSLADPWGIELGEDGVADADRGIYGTTVHGLFDDDERRRWILEAFAHRANKAFHSSLRYSETLDGAYERLADLVEEHLAVEEILEMAKEVTL